MTYVDFIGFIAGFCTTISFFPQVIKTYKTKSTEDISAGMFLILAFGLSLWIVYGVIINSLPIIIADVVGLSFIFIILSFKLKYG